MGGGVDGWLMRDKQNDDASAEDWLNTCCMVVPRNSNNIGKFEIKAGLVFQVLISLLKLLIDVFWPQ